MQTSIPTDLLQAVHDYLTTRPMREVEALVAGIRRECKPIETGGDNENRKAD